MEKNDISKIRKYLDSPETQRQLEIHHIGYLDRSCPDSLCYIIITFIILIIIIVLIILI